MLLGIYFDIKMFCKFLRSTRMVKMSMCQQNCDRCQLFLTNLLGKLICTCPRIDNQYFFCVIVDRKITVCLYRTNYILFYFQWCHSFPFPV